MNVISIHSDAKVAVPAELLSETNHRIANHLGLLVAMLRTQLTGISKGPQVLSRDAAKEMLQAVAGKLVSVSHLHHRLSEQPQLDGIVLSHYVVDLCAAFVSSLSLGERVCFVHKWTADCRLSADQAHYLGLMINEILINALKHAHPTGLPVQIDIRCEKRADGRVIISIGDDGVGLSEDMATRAAGVGFNLIRALTKSLDAELKIESDSLGLTFLITLPPMDAVKSLSAVGG
jgi:two-component sensor histidine kinase